MNKFYGFNPRLEIEHSSSNDWFKGITSIECITDIKPEDREKYLPAGEIQNMGSEKNDCVTRAVLNLLETKFNWLLATGNLTIDNQSWLLEKGYIQDNKVVFSDRWLAIKSGTSVKEGNSMKAVVDTAHNFGLIPKSIFPQVNNANEYYDATKITQEMEEIAAEFLVRFPINYEKVWQIHSEETLKEDMTITAGYAWSYPVDGVYPAEPTYPLNHCFMKIIPKWEIFDNYIDRVDGDFIKKLAPDYRFMQYEYRIAITAQNEVKKKIVQSIPWWQWLLNLFFRNPLVV